MPELIHHGARLHYSIEGAAGEPLLLIQGVGVAGTGWKPQVDALAKTHRLLAFDNRGVGHSAMERGAPFSIEQMVEDARALMDAAAWTSCHLVGHSMGGVIAQRLALTHPRRVRSLALLCTVARGADAVRFDLGTLWITLRTSLGSKSSRRRAFLELIYPKSFLAGVDRDALAAEVGDLFGRDLAVQPPIAMKQALALRRHDCRKELGRLAGLQTLVVSAAQDPIAPPRFGRQLAALIPGARYVELTEAAHGVTLHRAREISDLLASFIADASRRASPGQSMDLHAGPPAGTPSSVRC